MSAKHMKDFVRNDRLTKMAGDLVDEDIKQIAIETS